MWSDIQNQTGCRPGQLLSLGRTVGRLVLICWLVIGEGFVGACFGQADSKKAEGEAVAEKMEVKPLENRAFEFVSSDRVKSKKLDEISGVCHSSFSDDKFWVHNDSGGKPRLYLLSKSGKKLLEVDLKGAKNQDWEDLCCFRYQGKSYLLVADVGDNQQKRESVGLLILPEPDRRKVEGKKVSIKPVAAISFSYPDGPRNCESVAVSGKNVLLISKGPAKNGKDEAGSKKAKKQLFGSATVYRLPLDLANLGKKKLLAVKIGEIRGPLYATAADVSIDGNHLVVRDYARIFYFFKKSGQSWQDRLKKAHDKVFYRVNGRQNEAIGFFRNQKGFWTMSEGKQPKIWRSR